jgi:hypothetical protein
MIPPAAGIWKVKANHLVQETGRGRSNLHLLGLSVVQKYWHHSDGAGSTQWLRSPSRTADAHTSIPQGPELTSTHFRLQVALPNW